jgi:hypothetical protein
MVKNNKMQKYIKRIGQKTGKSNASKSVQKPAIMKALVE